MFSEDQLSALAESANIGSGNAATALSQMTGRPVDVSLPTAYTIPLADAVDKIGAADEDIVAVVLAVSGDLTALALLLFAPSAASELCDILGLADADDELRLSALGEIGNIISSSYVNALATLTGLALEPSPPTVLADMLGSVVSSALALSASASDVAIMLDSDLAIGGSSCSFDFLFVPDEESIHVLLSSLGLE